MKHIIMLIPFGVNVGLHMVALGLMRACEYQGLRAVCLKLVDYTPRQREKFDTERNLSQLENPLSIRFVEYLLGQGETDRLIEFFVAYVNVRKEQADIFIIPGITSAHAHSYANSLNAEIAQALNAEGILVLTPGNQTIEELSEPIEVFLKTYQNIYQFKMVGSIFTKVGAPIDPHGHIRFDLFDPPRVAQQQREALHFFYQQTQLPVLGCIPWNRLLMAPRTKDVADYLGAKVLCANKFKEQRILHFVMAAATIENMVHALESGVMVITSGDRADVVVATCMTALNGVNIAGILLTGGFFPGEATMAFCQKAIDQGVSILSVQTDSLRTSISLQRLSQHIPPDDEWRLEETKEHVAQHISKGWVAKLSSKFPEKKEKTPFAFRFSLIEKAQSDYQRIVLPEGDEDRVVKAANRCAQRKVAHCILLGNPEMVNQSAKNCGISLSSEIEIIDPDTIKEQYVAPLVSLRQHKGMNFKDACEWLDDPIVLGTMMLAQGHVDGLVAGSRTTTAQTIRPAFKLIGVKSGITKVSSVFFMCLSNQVLIYGDCAVNPNPSVEELADIAIQSAESALLFGINPKIAMISYRTGTSGQRTDVIKIEQATQLVKKRRPDLSIDGPLQYDTAFSPNVARAKAPHSLVAGHANVYIFPDLNTANTTYKAVQRSAKVPSIGPMLQGLKKPVNDLSRGASTGDIFYTIALTAIQASAQKK